MPYIERRKRVQFDAALSGCKPKDVGELTYCLYILCMDYLHSGYRYHDLAEVAGALTCTIQELYRRKIAPYENGKIEENGDV